MWRLEDPGKKSYFVGRRRIFSKCFLCQVRKYIPFRFIVIYNTSSMINDGTEPFCGGAVCQKVRTFGNYFSLFNIIFYLASYLQACEGAETCIVSCHRDQKVWDGSAYVEFSYDRTSKLSEVTGLNLTLMNIEENEYHTCTNPR